MINQEESTSLNSWDSPLLSSATRTAELRLTKFGNPSITTESYEIFYLGKNQCPRTQEGRQGTRIRHRRGIDHSRFQQSRPRWWWFCHCWWFLQHLNPQSLLGTMKWFIQTTLSKNILHSEIFSRRNIFSKVFESFEVKYI